MTVLVATGERHIARLCEVNLSRQGWSTHTVSTTAELVESARSIRPKLVVIDPNLEGHIDAESQLLELGIDFLVMQKGK